MARLGNFSPDWISPPGNTIVQILRDRGMSITEFSKEIGQSHDEVQALLDGRAPISIATARQLARVLGASVEFWMSRDCQYRDNVARLTLVHKEWLAELPVADMVKYNWMGPIPEPSMALASCLRYFDVPSVSVWSTRYEKLSEHYAFRKSDSAESRPAAIAAWLRQGEIEAAQVECCEWNRVLLQSSLPRMRSLTKIKDPNVFIPKLQDLCAKCGVAVVIVRAPSGCPASGATRFLPNGKALLQLSFRYLKDDHFWFSFFHEVGHLLLHGETGFFIEGDRSSDSPEEQAANDFAADVIVPTEYKGELMKLRADANSVMRFAVRVGVSAGIIVGQLQHLEVIGHERLNHLKRSYKWAE